MSRLLPPELSNERKKKGLITLLLLVRESEVEHSVASIDTALAVSPDILDYSITEDSLATTGLTMYPEMAELACFPSAVLFSLEQAPACVGFMAATGGVMVGPWIGRRQPVDDIPVLIRVLGY